ncbi:MAG: hypothetical protein QS748_12190 [Candidatus Endonucleobacter bathymodioli]|uniref:Uncharacterized protein n=1 Tax=Candidatus Endonucleibacter bathymodioli TaxID=539814 RepID=A0AA90STR6_9GAMM|nr:hypothetical protein [Candidatus Endonucleobacter bathymodioli]CAC9656441.1 hypothetical protein [uncultured Gammaproteobacteria bacterium]
MKGIDVVLDGTGYHSLKELIDIAKKNCRFPSDDFWYYCEHCYKIAHLFASVVSGSSFLPLWGEFKSVLVA